MLIIGVWSIVLGVTQIVEAFKARRSGSSSWVWLLISGIVGILFGIVLLSSPAAGALALLWVIGLFSLVFGVVFVVWAFKLRSAARELRTGMSERAGMVRWSAVMHSARPSAPPHLRLTRPVHARTNATDRSSPLRGGTGSLSA